MTPGGLHQFVVEDLDRANRMSARVMERYIGVARTLIECPGSYTPVFVVDAGNDDIVGEFCIVGCGPAVALRRRPVRSRSTPAPTWPRRRPG
jgi:hypothetical protein